jgi:predicted CXXCH cytochrome family protein
MKNYKLSPLLIAAALLVFGMSGISFAFHNGGVAECVGCHQMHNAVGPNLTLGVDDSSTCLLCHGESGQVSFHVATPSADMPAGTPPANEGPGGDFGWLAKNYDFTLDGTATSVQGYTHGHNIIAAGYDNGYLASPDQANSTAPGGTFPSGELACTSCHDQHGKGRWLTAGTYAQTGQSIWTSGSYGDLPSTASTGEALATGVYRLLRAVDSVSNVTFPATPPVAVVNSDYNRSEFFTQTRTAYSSGMGDFCGTCHPDMHSTAAINRHPTNQVASPTVISNYNSYIKTGNMNGSPITSYLSLVPFEEGQAAYSTATIGVLKSHAQTDNSVLNGPGSGTVPATMTITCLSCHRAHASAWKHMLRWNSEVPTITVAGAYPTGNEEGFGLTTQEVSKAYYDYNVTTWSAFQRQLCNKCHAMD